MPSFDLYKKINGQKQGRVRKEQSDKIMLETWDRDITSQTAYIYDFYHDSEPLKLRGLDSEHDELKTPIEVKFFLHSQQTFDKDTTTFHLQLQPGQKCNVDYYDECFKDRYGAIFPIGLYIDIMDESGQRNKWIIVDLANYYGNQFPTFEVLPCDQIIQYIYKNKKYQIAGCTRSRMSYGSGLWNDFKILNVQDQAAFIVPLNRDTEKIFYNMRMILDGKVETEPRVWQVSRTLRIDPNGICRVTLYQTVFDEHFDYIEKDADGNIVGMWADYFSSTIEPIENTPLPPENHLEITYSGAKPEIKSGGSYKKFTVNFYDADENPISFEQGTWSFDLEGNNATDLLDIKTDGLDENQIKIKFTGGDMYIGKNLNVCYESVSGIIGNVLIEIKGL